MESGEGSDCYAPLGAAVDPVRPAERQGSHPNPGHGTEEAIATHFNKSNTVVAKSPY